MRFPYYKQLNDWFCGPAVVQMILAADGIKISQPVLAKEMATSPYEGTSRQDLVRILRRHRYKVVTKTYAKLADVKRMLADGWYIVVNYREVEENIGHYAIVLAVTSTSIVFNDPYHGRQYRLPRSVFLKRWFGHANAYGQWFLAAKQR